MKYRKKPIIVEAVQRNGDNLEECLNFMSDNGFYDYGHNCNKEIVIKTLEGNIVASVNDYIIKGVSGEFYPCKPNIFEKTYEEVNE